MNRDFSRARAARWWMRWAAMVVLVLGGSGCVEMTTNPASGCVTDADCPEGLTCFVSEVGGFCDRDSDNNGVADMIDLGFAPDPECEGEDCFQVTGVPGAGCESGADCLNGLCYQGSCMDGSDGAGCVNSTQCLAGFCNTQGNCGVLTDGMACGAHDDCQNGHCHSSNGTCGTVTDGQSCGQAADCDTGSCPPSGICGVLALGETCEVPSDCGSTFCSFQTSVCTTGAVGEPCDEYPKDDDDGECASAICHSVGYCTDGVNGDLCDSNSDCSGDITCEGVNGSTTCSDLMLGSACSNSDDYDNENDCLEGYCYKNICQAGTNGQSCGGQYTYSGEQDNDCAHKCIDGLCSDGLLGQSCSADVHCLGEADAPLQCSSGVCIAPGQLALGEICEVPSDCGSTFCSFQTSVCTTGAVGEPCDNNPSDDDDGECASAICHSDGYCTDGVNGDLCDSNSDCSGDITCEGVNGSTTCSDLMIGSACSNSDDWDNENDCLEGYCYNKTCQAGTNGQSCGGQYNYSGVQDNDCAHECVGGLCSDGLLGQSCSADVHCLGEADAPLQCSSGVCIAPGQLALGEICEVPSDCGSTFCSFTTFLCTTGAVGEPCDNNPSDDDHGECASAICHWDGYCTDGVNGDLCDSNSDCSGDITCEGVNGSTTCSDLMIGSACSNSDDWDNENDCLEGYCYNKICQAGTNGQPCGGQYNYGKQDNDCAHECVGGLCSDGLLGQSCSASAPCAPKEGESLVCSGGTCQAIGCSSQDDCDEGLYCFEDKAGEGVCATGDLAGRCAGDEHCGPGLECLDFHSLDYWYNTATSTVCTDQEEGSPCEDPTGDCAGDLQCVGVNHLASIGYDWPETVTTITYSSAEDGFQSKEVSLAPLGDYGICTAPHPGSDCILALNEGYASSNDYDEILGNSFCGDDLWIPNLDFTDGVLGSSDMDPLGKKRKLTCLPDPGCGQYLSPDNPYCHGVCGFARPGGRCLGHMDDEGETYSGWGSSSSYWKALGCEAKQLCDASDRGCIEQKYGDTCYTTCASGLKCFGGSCVYENCVPDCDGKSCGDDGCGGSCGSCSSGSLCVDGNCPGGVLLVIKGDWSADNESTWSVQTTDWWAEPLTGPNAGPDNDTEEYLLLMGGGDYELVLTDSDDDGGLDAWVYACGTLLVEFEPHHTEDDWSEVTLPFSVPESCPCVPQCGVKTCGDDGCGGSCGTCSDGGSCQHGACVCTPSCDGKSCGDDGCGGACGVCEGTDVSCQGGQCAYQGVGASCGEETCIYSGCLSDAEGWVGWGEPGYCTAACGAEDAACPSNSHCSVPPGSDGAEHHCLLGCDGDVCPEGLQCVTTTGSDLVEKKVCTP